MLNSYTRKLIEQKAYELWEDRMKFNIPGCALGDWLEAKKRVNEEIRESIESCKDKRVGNSHEW